MPKTGVFFKYWLPVLCWMGVIFTASSDSHSYEHSSQLIMPLLYWLFPHISADAANWIVFLARKCAHVTEYAVFAMLLWRALRKPVKDDPRPWNRRQAGWVLLVAFLYAVSDEIHQIFVPTRTPRIHDVVIDTIGAAAGLLLLWGLDRRRKRRQPPS